MTGSRISISSPAPPRYRLVAASPLPQRARLVFRSATVGIEGYVCPRLAKRLREFADRVLKVPSADRNSGDRDSGVSEFVLGLGASGVKHESDQLLVGVLDENLNVIAEDLNWGQRHSMQAPVNRGVEVVLGHESVSVGVVRTSNVAVDPDAAPVASGDACKLPGGRR